MEKLWNGGQLRVCQKCSTGFIQYERFEQNQKYCPRCNDERQKRPSVVQERREIRRFEPVLVASLPTNYEFIYQEGKGHRDLPFYKMDISKPGKGASWSGRIVIYSHDPIKEGDVISIREMETVHKVKRVHYQENIFDSGKHSEFKDLPLDEEVSDPDVKVEIVNVSRPYLFFEKIDTNLDDCIMKLHTIVRHSKTTLKGYGRQYKFEIDASNAIASWSCISSARSGRFWTELVIAITSNEHPVFVKGMLEADGDDEVIS